MIESKKNKKYKSFKDRGGNRKSREESHTSKEWKFKKNVGWFMMVNKNKASDFPPIKCFFCVVTFYKRVLNERQACYFRGGKKTKVKVHKFEINGCLCIEANMES